MDALFALVEVWSRVGDVMDGILAFLNASRESRNFPLVQKAARFAAFGLPLLLFTMAVLREAVLADVRTALRLAGITPKAAAIEMGISEGLLSNKLSGERPLTFDALLPLPLGFWQWLPVVMAERYGVPSTITAGARLARRQARMALTSQAHAKKVGVA